MGVGRNGSSCEILLSTKRLFNDFLDLVGF